ncbi:MAG: biopolymer transporter ExbD [Deltaproteobacteria bacterium]|nr:biopolymer transporter ExbD [Deltaproteobacteria bacterium]MBW2306821.1 biopolymer transporter ExbD [Deltaproteobacteria bacterium]
MKLKKRTRRNVRIEIIPLIDIMFLLLVFFIYAMLSMSVHRGIAVELPFAKNSLIEKRSYHDISIARSGALFLDTVPVTLKELPAVLAGLKHKDPGVEIRISGDRKSAYEMIVRVMDAVRGAGIRKISLETAWRIGQ